MKALVVLGNGFDLDLGIDTTFKSFIKSYDFQTHSYTPLMKEFIKNSEIDRRWCDIESIFRRMILEYCADPKDDMFDNINDSWQMINRAWGIYLPEITRLNKISINKSSCAYRFLSRNITQSTLYSFNYTSPYYLAGFIDRDEPIHIHGAFEPRELSPQELMYMIPNDLIIGVDSNVESVGAGCEKLKHIIKQKHPKFAETHLKRDLYEADVVMFFGHSLGITDSDYFRDFFVSLMDENKHKHIVFITKDSASIDDIKRNINTMGIVFSELEHRVDRISVVFTEDGPDDRFNEFLTLL